MAQKIEEVNGIVPDTNYPKGYKIVDGSTDVNAKLYQDIVQFFQKLLKTAAITASGEDDNEIHGYQYLTALYATLRTDLLPTRSPQAKIGLALWASLTELKAGTNVENYINSFLLKEQTGGYFRKTVEIGVWNMNATPRVTVPHLLVGTEWLTIRNAYVVIQNDAGTYNYPLNMVDYTDPSVNGGIYNFSSTDITLDRVTSGFFDNANFESTSINRGFITFDYIPD